MAADEAWAARVRALNDQLRTGGPTTPSHNRWLLTQGVLALGSPAVDAVIESIRSFSEFTEDNDPYGEHDFGSVTVGGQVVFWKIDYYDRSLAEGSPDPADEALTCRVLTIMFSAEY